MFVTPIRPPARRSASVAVLVAAAVMAVLAVLAVPDPAFTQVPSTDIEELSLDEAIRLAHEYNPDYRIQASQIETADWRMRQAWGSLVPSASASTGFGYTASGERRFESVQLATEPATYSSRYSVGLSLSMDGSTLLRPGVVRDQIRASEAQIEGASAGLINEVTANYLAVLQADEELRQARAELERTDTYVRQAEAQVEVGAATPLDIRRAESQRGQAEVALVQAENAAATTRLTLGRSLGVPLREGTELTTGFDLFEPDLDHDELMELALDANPVLRASRSQANAARSETRIARTRYLPSVSLSAGWTGSVFQAAQTAPLVADRLRQVEGQYESCLQENRIRDLLGDPPRDCSIFDVSNPSVEADVRQQVRSQNRGFPFDYNPQPLSLSMSVSIPLFTGFSRQLQVEEARVAERNAEQQVRSEELRLDVEVESAMRAVETAHRTVELQQRNRETAAEELRLAQERFRLGLASSIEVVDAQANLSDAERAEISAIYDFHVSFAQLEALVGRPLRD